ncbi:MAG TPA: signal peptidase I [Patescibacteria group bacterium]|nr:signal peptidase I [Patescibacteria group bacterium]
MNFWQKLYYGAGVAFELGRVFILLVVALLIVHYFLATIFIISGPSMESNFHDNEIVLVSRFNLFTNKFTRGEPMVLKFPGDPKHKKYIKRLIGLPGDTVEIRNSQFWINDKQLPESYLDRGMPTMPAQNEQTLWTLEKDQYFLVGDNRLNSADSRDWGTAERADMLGPVKMILFPPSRFQFIAVPPY